MCGIAGVLKGTSKKERTEIVKLMTQRLVHRGPDAYGIISRERVTLGHRRLSIVDLNDASNQPIQSKETKSIVCFNGEIYNFIELRNELEASGMQFTSCGDAEVILKGYDFWGTEIFSKLNGMFAIAIWDERKQKLILARDRMGEKPLFYFFPKKGGIVFASELKALMIHPEFPREINPGAFSQYLSLNYILGDMCIIKGVAKLAPAQFIVLSPNGSIRSHKYWNLRNYFVQKREDQSFAVAKKEFAELFDNSVQMRTRCDVPFGAFLSGGVDSSAVVSSMTQYLGQSQTKTFSIGFREPSYSELPEARTAAEYMGVFHRAKIVEANLTNELPRIVWAADEPFADNSMIPAYFLAEFARRHVKTCLSGDAGDELFAGYETYKADKIHHVLSFLSPSITNPFFQLMTSCIPVSDRKISFGYKIKKFASGIRLDPMHAHYSWRQIFSRDEMGSILLDDVSPFVLEVNAFDQFSGFASQVPGCHYLDQAMYVDLNTWLVDDILVKVDRSSMAHSLEVRAPFLDHRLVEFAASLPVAWKLKGLRSKYILKKALEARFPANFLNCKKKGFNAPVSNWLRGPFKELAWDTLHNQYLSEWFNIKEIQKIWENHELRVSDNSFKLFSLISLGLWLERYHRELKT